MDVLTHDANTSVESRRCASKLPFGFHFWMMFSCNKCPRTFTLLEYYERHRRVHKLRRQHVCPICQCVYGAAKGLEHHINLHQELQQRGTGLYTIHSTLPAVDGERGLNGLFVCPLCPRSFVSVNSLLKHLPLHARKVQHACHVCCHVFGKKASLLQHVATQHAEDQSTWILNNDPRSASKAHQSVKENLEYHVKSISEWKKSHTSEIASYETFVQQGQWPLHCIKGCQVSLEDLEAFKRHMNQHWTHTKCCPVCNQCIASKRFNFKQHLKVHTGEKPFVCGQCNRAFRQKAHLMKHQTTHHAP